MLSSQKHCEEPKGLGLDRMLTQIKPNIFQQEPHVHTLNEPMLNMLKIHFLKMVIREHGGDIWYEAKEHGSNFVMILPIEGC